jgi:hypothetical protein
MCVEFHCPLFGFCNVFLPLYRHLSIHSSWNLFSKIKIQHLFLKGYILLKPSVLYSKQKNALVEKTIFLYIICKAIPAQAYSGPEGSRRLRLPDFKTIGK